MRSWHQPAATIAAFAAAGITVATGGVGGWALEPPAVVLVGYWWTIRCRSSRNSSLVGALAGTHGGIGLPNNGVLEVL